MNDVISECILHKGSVTNAGYGQVARRINGKLKVYGAHRYAWIQANGPIENGLHVLHQCDNKLCVNVEHMRLGTQAENVREAVERNTGIGASAGRKRLNAEQAAQIKTALKRGAKILDLAKQFNVSHLTIRAIKKGRAWSHIAV